MATRKKKAKRQRKITCPLCLEPSDSLVERNGEKMCWECVEANEEAEDLMCEELSQGGPLAGLPFEEPDDEEMNLSDEDEDYEDEESREEGL